MTEHFCVAAWDQNIPSSAVYLKCRNWGMPHAKALQMAEDCSSEAYARSLQHSFESFSHFRSWVTVTACNFAIDVLRMSRRHAVVHDDMAMPVDSPENSREIEIMLTAIDTLPDQERLVINLWYFQNRTLEEIADELGLLTAGSKNARLLRAKRIRDAALRSLRKLMRSDD